MQPIVLRLSPEVREKVELLARVTGVSRETIVAEAVGRFVDQQLLALAEAVKAGGVQVASDVQQAGSDPSSPEIPAPERWKIIV